MGLNMDCKKGWEWSNNAVEGGVNRIIIGRDMHRALGRTKSSLHWDTWTQCKGASNISSWIVLIG